MAKTINEQALYELGVAIYESRGPQACVEFAIASGIKDLAYCEPCEAEQPHIENKTVCFVCGSAVEPK